MLLYLLLVGAGYASSGLWVLLTVAFDSYLIGNLTDSILKRARTLTGRFRFALFAYSVLLASLVIFAASFGSWLQRVVQGPYPSFTLGLFIVEEFSAITPLLLLVNILLTHPEFVPVVPRLIRIGNRIDIWWAGETWRKTFQTLPIVEYVRGARQRTSVIWWGMRPSLDLNAVHHALNLPSLISAPLIRLDFLPEHELVSLFDALDIRARTFSVRGFAEWDSFSKSGITVRYKNGLDWHSKTAVNYSLRDLASDTKGNPEFSRRVDPLSLEPRDFEDDVIVTAYNPVRKQRLIVDGIHRAAILTNESNDKSAFPSARVIECYGEKVDWLFPCDFGRLDRGKDDST